jgi:hypothetical protein
MKTHVIKVKQRRQNVRIQKLHDGWRAVLQDPPLLPEKDSVEVKIRVPYYGV